MERWRVRCGSRSALRLKDHQQKSMNEDQGTAPVCKRKRLGVSPACFKPSMKFEMRSVLTLASASASDLHTEINRAYLETTSGANSPHRQDLRILLRLRV